MKYSKICLLFLVSILFSGIGFNYGLGINTDMLVLRRVKGGGGDSITKIVSLLTGNTFNLIAPYLNNLPVGYNLHQSADLIRFISDSADFFNQNTPDTGYMDRFVNAYVQAKIEGMNLPANELSEQDIAGIINDVFDDNFFNALPALEFLDYLNRMSQAFPEIKEYLVGNNFIPSDFFAANGEINLPSNMTSEALSAFAQNLYKNEALLDFLYKQATNFLSNVDITNPTNVEREFAELEHTAKYVLGQIIQTLEWCLTSKNKDSLGAIKASLEYLAASIDALMLVNPTPEIKLLKKRCADARLITGVLPGLLLYRYKDEIVRDTFMTRDVQDRIGGLKDITERVRIFLETMGGSYVITDPRLGYIFESVLSDIIKDAKSGIGSVEEKTMRVRALSELSKVTTCGDGSKEIVLPSKAIIDLIGLGMADKMVLEFVTIPGKTMPGLARKPISVTPGEIEIVPGKYYIAQINPATGKIIISAPGQEPKEYSGVTSYDSVGPRNPEGSSHQPRGRSLTRFIGETALALLEKAKASGPAELRVQLIQVLKIVRNHPLFPLSELTDRDLIVRINRETRGF